MRTTLLGAIACMLLVSGCGTRTLSPVTPSGEAQVLVWPEPGQATWRPTAPTVKQIKAIEPGMGKSQLYRLLGVPHFREGMAGVREWNYTFELNDAGHVHVCQFKVLFDLEMKARKFHWRDADCEGVGASWRNGATAPPQTVEPLRPFATFSTDVMFDFGSSTLNEQGKEELDALAAAIFGNLVQPGYKFSIVVRGHTDHIGSAEDNLRLSQGRADVVRDYLHAARLGQTATYAEARGEREPIVTCAPGSRVTQIACLAKNRRVEILIRPENQ